VKAPTKDEEKKEGVVKGQVEIVENEKNKEEEEKKEKKDSRDQGESTSTTTTSSVAKSGVVEEEVVKSVAEKVSIDDNVTKNDS